MDYIYFGFDIKGVVLPHNVPINIIQGDCEYITPTDMVQKYYDNMDINSKNMDIIVNTGHTPFIDNSKSFC